MYQIEFYETAKGKSEVVDYLEELRKSKSKNSRIKANKIRIYMRALKEHGLALSEPEIKKIDKNIWELRPLKDRFLFAHWDGDKFIILTHFVKSTQKTPKAEIDKANRYLKDYIKRSNKNE